MTLGLPSDRRRFAARAYPTGSDPLSTSAPAWADTVRLPLLAPLVVDLATVAEHGCQGVLPDGPPLTRQDLVGLLEPDTPAVRCLTNRTSDLQTLVAAYRVDGVTPGCYRYLRAAHSLSAFGPVDLFGQPPTPALLVLFTTDDGRPAAPEVLVEAGARVQAISTAAVALGLTSEAWPGWSLHGLATSRGLPAGYGCHYLVAIG